jgi:hypothetical protein
MKHRVAMIAVGALLLAACGSREEENAAAPTPAPVKRVAAPVDPTADMAIAPGDDRKGDGDLVVKYSLPSAPVAGAPLEVDLAFVSTADLSAGTLSYSAQPGLRLAGDVSGALPALKAGEVERRKVTLTPESAGITYFSVSVTRGQAPDTTTRVFSVPLIVGDGSGVALPKTPAAAAPKKPA